MNKKNIQIIHRLEALRKQKDVMPKLVYMSRLQDILKELKNENIKDINVEYEQDNVVGKVYKLLNPNK